MKAVTIYTTSTCGFCKMAKVFLAEHNVAYKEKNVATDRAMAQEMIERSGQMGVPVFVIGEGDNAQVLIGFDESKLANALELPSASGTKE